MALLNDAAKGIRWTTLSMLLVSITEIIRLVVLGRILGPESFGLLAMMMVVIGLAQLIGQMGLNEAIIQRPDPTQTELSTLYWLNIGIGGLLYAIVLVLTPLIAALYSATELVQMMPWAALAFVISPWGSQIKALLQKQLNFKPLAIIEILATAAGAIIAIALAQNGYGAWSLIWGALAKNILTTLSLLLAAKQLKLLPQFSIDLKAVKPYLSFGLHLLGSNILNYFNSRIDQLVIGILLGPQALGYYSMAFNLVLQPVSRINPALTQVAFPVLTKVRLDKVRLQRGYFRMLNLLTSFNAPVLIGVAATAPLLIPVFLGEKWAPIIPLIQVLALFSLLRSIGNAGGSLILACGRADIALYWNLALCAFIPVTVFIGSQVGALQGVAWALLGLQLALLFAWYHFVVRKLLGNCFAGFIGSIITPVAFAIPMAIAVVAISPLLSTLPAVMQLAIQILLGATIYIALSFVLRRKFVVEQLQMLFNRNA